MKWFAKQKVRVVEWNAGSAGAGAGTAAPLPATVATPLAALIAGHIIQDGELILLILKPSLWFIVLSMLKSAAFISILMIASVLFDDHLPGHSRTYIEVGILALSGRLVWSILQWIGQLYILTEMRLLTLSGVFSQSIFDCPLRKIVRTRILRTMRERLMGLGSVEIIPVDENYSIGIWQTIAQPLAVNDQIIAAINRAKQGRCDP